MIDLSEFSTDQLRVLLADLEAEDRRRTAAREREARLHCLEENQGKLVKKIDRVSRTANEAKEMGRVAIHGRVRLGQQLEAEIAERKGDRDRIQGRVTDLEVKEIDRNRQNRR